jgi:hypothetical protein
MVFTVSHGLLKNYSLQKAPAIINVVELVLGDA